LPLALAQLPQQKSVEIIRRVIGVIAAIDCVQNVLEDSFGQVGKGVGIFKFLNSDPSRSGFRLNEAKPDCLFLLIVSAGKQFPLGRCNCHGEILTDLSSHEGRECVDGCCPGGGKRVVPRRWKKLVHNGEIGLNKARLKNKF
jgi:hypothetical protein